MTALIIIGGILLFLVLLALLPVSVCLKVSDSLTMDIKIWFLTFRAAGQKTRKTKPLSGKKYQKKLHQLEDEEKEEEKPKKPKKGKKDKKEKTNKITPDFILQLLHAIRDILGTVLSRFFGLLYIRINKLDVRCGLSDAADTALVTGSLISAAQWLAETLTRFARFDENRSAEIHIEPDYLHNKFSTDMDLFFQMRVFGFFALLHTLIVLFFRYRKLLNKII